MRLLSFKACGALTGFLMLTTLAIGQIRTQQPRNGESSVQAKSDEAAILDKAMLTPGGRQLAERLQHLRRSESTLGEKHPSMAAIRAEIAQVLKEIGVSAATAPALPEALAGMDDQQLRQLVLRLYDKIDRLETRIVLIERQMQVH